MAQSKAITNSNFNGTAKTATLKATNNQAIKVATRCKISSVMLTLMQNVAIPKARVINENTSVTT
ncbi:MAG: hypothetical protein KME64_38875 [Scytonematopsis contorta HA4267-MV1]|nr:hypothetical protein [Scytonematopsis contorta HA4267-MV1]